MKAYNIPDGNYPATQIGWVISFFVGQREVTIKGSSEKTTEGSVLVIEGVLEFLG